MSDNSSQSWYTKYRPSKMSDYIGPEIKHIVQKRFNKRENMPHVIMVHGNRGTGKTTLSRILTKYYLCKNPHEDGTPCEECETCQSINEILIDGKNAEIECPGVQEVDATTANGKEAIQNIVEDAMQPPLYTKYKIIIFDECHMITPAAQNSLLKIVEDIPQHLIVIFATTNPEKVLQTIKSRCQLILEAKKQSVKDLIHRLSQISEQENLQFSNEALEIIAKKGDRVPRECINLLESIAKTYDNVVNVDNVRDYINDSGSELYVKYFDAANKSLSDIMTFIRELNTNNVKIPDFTNGLTRFCLDAIYIKNGIGTEDYPPEYVELVKHIFDLYTPDEFDILLQILEYMNNNIRVDDDVKNELLLTTTAMRISKIDMITSDENNPYKQAIIENKESLVEHGKRLRADNKTAIEKLSSSLGLADINDNFEDVKEVNVPRGLLDNVDIPTVPSIDNNDETSDGNQNNGSEEVVPIDKFFE